MKTLISILLLLPFIFASCETEDIKPTEYAKIEIKKAFFFGDSHSRAGHFDKYTAEALGCEYSKCSRSGSQAKHYINADSINKMVTYNPDIVIIRLGTNDVMLNDDISVAYRNYDKLISMIKEKTDCPIVFVNITNISNAGPDLHMRIILFNSYLKSKGAYVDLFNNSDYNYIYPDLVHFKSNGYKQQGEYTAQVIKNTFN